MYEAHFGLKDKPFNLIPDPEYLFLSSQHQVALSLLEYALMETAAGLTVLTGEVGAGKTTLIRKLIRRLDYRELTIGIINNTGNFGDAMMHWVSSAFGLPHENKDSVALFRDFQQFLIDEYAAGKRVVLVVDEAQNLGGKSLEELRMLSNINADRDQLLQIMLSGQPELLEILQRPELAQIAQRVSVEFHLEALDLENVREYIRHRLEVAGSGEALFEDEAVQAIYYYSGGIPRLINTLCDYSLVHAFASDRDSVDLKTALAISRGRRIGGINHHTRTNPEMETVRREILDRHGIDLADARL